MDLIELNRSPAQFVRKLNCRCYGFCLLNDEKLLACGQSGGSVIGYHLDSEDLLPEYAKWRFFWAWGMSTAFKLDGSLIASGSEPGTIHVWNTTTSKLVSSLTGGQAEIVSLAFFPDNRRLVARGTGDVRQWDYETSQELISLPFDDASVRHVSVSDDGKSILAVGKQGKLRVWSVLD